MIHNNSVQKIRILVVDDSAFVRSAIKSMLKNDPELEVIATAGDGQEALEKIENLKPDIVTMDIEMPRMDGLTALKIIMEKMPLPVLVISSATNEGADSTFRALDLGAADFICKDAQYNSMGIKTLETTLISKIKGIVRSRTRQYQMRPAAEDTPPSAPGVLRDRPKTSLTEIVAIGVSTGGPKALQSVIPFLPKDFNVPVLIVQHMPVLFTKPFAERLNSMSQLEVKEAETGDVAEPGKVFLARGGIHLKVERKGSKVTLVLDKSPDYILYRPSVDVMMLSVAEVYRAGILGVIMTGMGNDGTQGLKAIKQSGGKTLAQDEKSCVVFGMPKSAIEAGVVDRVAPLTRLANEIINMA